MRIDSRDVLDPNAKTRRSFRAQVQGHFRCTGANAWDDYEYMAQPEGEIEVLPGLPIQMERYGAVFRIRKQGRALRAEWSPSATELERTGDGSSSACRRLFLTECVEGFAEAAGQGGAAAIASKLGDD
jgi:hypothetical protein